MSVIVTHFRDLQLSHDGPVPQVDYVRLLWDEGASLDANRRSHQIERLGRAAQKGGAFVRANSMNKALVPQKSLALGIFQLSAATALCRSLVIGGPPKNNS